jgi:hypothetical protein
MSCQMTEIKDLSSLQEKVQEAVQENLQENLQEKLPLPENASSSGMASRTQRPVVTTMSGDFDPSSVVNNIRRMMTDPLKPETLRPVVPAFVSSVRERPIRESALKPEQDQTMVTAPFKPMPLGSSQRLPTLQPIQTNPSSKLTPQMSQSRELVPYNRSLKHVLSTLVLGQWSRNSWIAIAGVVLMGGLATLFVSFSNRIHIPAPSSSALSPSVASPSGEVSASAQNNAALPSAETQPPIDWKKGVVASSGGGGATAATVQAVQAAPLEPINPLVAKKPAKDTAKVGEMGLRVGETLPETEIASPQANNTIAVRTVKVETITVKPPVESVIPRLPQPSTPAKSNTLVPPVPPALVARNDLNVPTIEAPRTEPKIAPKVDLSKTVSKIVEKPIEKPVEKVAEKKPVEAVVAPVVALTPVKAPSVAPTATPTVQSSVAPAPAIKPVAEAAKAAPVAPAVTVAVASVVAVTPPPSVFDRLVTRADSLIKQGAIADARQLLTRAAEDGHAKAAFRLAETYDARVLETWGVRGGVKGETQKARIFYQQALSGGMSEAQTRLDQLK